MTENVSLCRYCLTTSVSAFALTCARCGRIQSFIVPPLGRRMLGCASGLRTKILIWMLMQKSQKLLRKLELSRMKTGHLRQQASEASARKTSSPVCTEIQESPVFLGIGTDYKLA